MAMTPTITIAFSSLAGTHRRIRPSGPGPFSWRILAARQGSSRSTGRRPNASEQEDGRAIFFTPVSCSVSLGGNFPELRLNRSDIEPVNGRRDVGDVQTELTASSFGPQMDVAWQGGRSMLCGPDFYKRSAALANNYCKGWP